MHITIISSSPKLEVFKGNINEYYNTFYGAQIDDFEGIQSYRFDIPLTNIQQNYSLRFITHDSELWIFGLHILFQNGSYDYTEQSDEIKKNIQRILSRSEFENAQSEASEKHKILKQLFSTVSDLRKEKFHNLDSGQLKEHQTNLNSEFEKLYMKIETLIDIKFRELEKRQNEKFEQIITLIEKINDIKLT